MKLLQIQSLQFSHNPFTRFPFVLIFFSLRFDIFRFYNKLNQSNCLYARVFLFTTLVKFWSHSFEKNESFARNATDRLKRESTITFGEKKTNQQMRVQTFLGKAEWNVSLLFLVFID